MRSSKAVWTFCTPRVITLFLVLKKVFKSLKEIFCRLGLTAKTMLHKSVTSVKFYSFRDYHFFLRILWSCSIFWKHFICWNMWNKKSFQRYLCFIFLVFLLPSFFFLHGFVSHIKNVVLPSLEKLACFPLKDRLEGFF